MLRCVIGGGNNVPHIQLRRSVYRTFRVLSRETFLSHLCTPPCVASFHHVPQGCVRYPFQCSLLFLFLWKVEKSGWVLVAVFSLARWTTVTPGSTGVAQAVYHLEKDQTEVLKSSIIYYTKNILRAADNEQREIN